MKIDIKILLCCIVISFSASAQISTTKVAEPNNSKPASRYDSLENYLGENVIQYLGQELYVNGKSESLRKYGYKGFRKSLDLLSFDTSGTYKCCDGFGSKYDELSGRYFKVIKIYSHPEAKEKEYLYGDKYYFKLKSRDVGDTVYFEYSSKYEHSFPFIVVGFYEKLKDKVVGQKFVFGNTEQRFGDDQPDLLTGKPIVFKVDDRWECVDVTIEEKYYSLSLVLKDKQGQTLAVSYEIVIGDKRLYNIFTDAQAKKYLAKFGSSNWSRILEGKVRVGMTKEMCELSWGKPEKINKTTTRASISEQWVYDDNYLYFNGNILEAIQ